MASLYKRERPLKEQVLAEFEFPTPKAFISKYLSHLDVHSTRKIDIGFYGIKPQNWAEDVAFYVQLPDIGEEQDRESLIERSLLYLDDLSYYDPKQLRIKKNYVVFFYREIPRPSILDVDFPELLEPEVEIRYVVASKEGREKPVFETRKGKLLEVLYTVLYANNYRCASKQFLQFVSIPSSTILELYTNSRLVVDLKSLQKNEL